MKLTIDEFLKKQYMVEPDFEIYNYSDTAIPYVAPHRHLFYEIYYVLSEALEYVVENRVYQMKKGDFLLLPPGQLHYPAESNIKLGIKYSRIVFWCNTDFFDRFAQIDPSLDIIWDTVKQHKIYHFSPTQSVSQHLYDLFIFLFSEKRQHTFAYTGSCFAILLEIFVLLARIIHACHYEAQRSPADNLFVDIIYYIHTHITDRLSLDDLAAHFWVSKAYISRLFREYIGLSVHQYILSIRLDGCRTAITRGMSITQAATLFGFQEYSTFFRAFRKGFGMSPAEFVASLKKEQPPCPSSLAENHPIFPC